MLLLRHMVTDLHQVIVNETESQNCTILAGILGFTEKKSD